MLLFAFSGAAFSNATQAVECPSPRINDVMSDPIVVSAMESAWSNSKEGTSDEHIEGFTIYQCYDALAVDGDVYTTQVDWGNGTVTSITYPPSRANSACRLVGNFHTHPGVGTSHPQSNDPYESDRPSPSEANTDLPGIIRYGLGPISGEGKTNDITYGPDVSSKLSWTCAGTVSDVNASSNQSVVAGAVPVSYADPHLITLDGIAFGFQAIGEFLLAQSSLGTFTIQARQTQTGPVSSQVSVNSGFAFKVGNDEVAVAFNSSNDLQVFVNNEQQTEQGDIVLPNGGQLSIASSLITVSWPDGSKAIISVYSSFLNLSLLVADVHKGQLSGLLGNYDGNMANDMRTNLGVDISITPQADQLYGNFTQGWRVTDETSLFVYANNENTWQTCYR